MAFKENTTTSEKAATLIKETENINAELAEIDRQLAEMENSPDKPEVLGHISHISHAGKNDNIGIFGIFDPMVQKQEKLLPEFPIECFPDVIKDYTKGIADTLAKGVAMAMMNNQQNPINVTCYAELKTEDNEVLARAVTKGQKSIDRRLHPTLQFGY